MKIGYAYAIIIWINLTSSFFLHVMVFFIESIKKTLQELFLKSGQWFNGKKQRIIDHIANRGMFMKRPPKIYNSHSFEMVFHENTSRSHCPKESFCFFESLSNLKDELGLGPVS